MSRYGGNNRFGGNSGGRHGGSRNGGSRGFGGRGARKNEFGIGRGQPGAGLKAPDWNQMNLKGFQKNFWTPSSDMTPEAVQAWLAEKEIKVYGDGIPQPILSFDRAKFPSGMENVLNLFAQAGFSAPTPIQAQGWPMALSGRDVVGVAETGSGKTLAFIIPAIMHIMGQPPLERGDGPIALVVAPTRELAIQIEAEAKRFSAGFGLKIGCVYGGAPKRPQENNLRNGLDIVVCTPGRMLDFLENRKTNCWRVTYLVFDEADRMLDMGFEPQIRSLVSQIRPDRQVLMWSATWPRDVEQLAQTFLKNGYIKLHVGSDEGKCCSTITQQVHIVSSYQKTGLFQTALRDYSNQKVLVFTATKRMADQLSHSLNRQGWNTQSIHGDKRQEERQRVLRDFKAGRINIMIATDVAGRGIHIENIALVINYDFPQNCDDYVHRIGRTGRRGQTGTAITYFDPKTDSKKAGRFIKVLTDSNQQIPPELYQIQQRWQGNGRGRNRFRKGRGGRGGGFNRRSRQY